MLTRNLTAGALVLTFTAGAATAPATAEERVRLLGETTVPHALRFQGTTVGGLSGIDFDPRTGGWVLISDDRSELQPARFYTAKIPVGADGVGEVDFTGTAPLRRENGSTYPKSTVDPEEIRVDPWRRDYWWSSEGERDERFIDPSIRAAASDGGWRGQLPLAPNLAMAEDTGPRQNEALEGMTFAAGGTLVVNSVEGPLIQDGESPTFEHGALGRITVQARQGEVLAQYAYSMDRVFAQSPTGGSSNNGVVSILASNPATPSRYLVMERSYVTGVGNSIRIYEIDTRGATNVEDVPSLRTAEVRPVRKVLVADLADLGLNEVDNVEGMTWGPRLPSGERTLVLVSDDNFSAGQTTQVIALALR